MLIMADRADVAVETRLELRASRFGLADPELLVERDVLLTTGHHDRPAPWSLEEVNEVLVDPLAEPGVEE